MQQEWIRVYQRMLRQVIKDKALTGQLLRVLLYLVAYQGYGQGVMVRQATVAEELGIPRPNVSRALRLLCERGWISRKRTLTGVMMYCLSKGLAQKGQQAQPRRKEGTS